MPDTLVSRLLVLCFAANLLQGTAFSLFLHFPGFLDRLGAGTSLIGIVAALTSLSAIACSPAVGRMLDLTGRRLVILAASAVNVALCVGFMLIDVLGPEVVALRMLHGATEMALHVALFTYALDVIPAARRSQGLALFGVSALAAVGLGAVLGDVGYDLAGYRGVFVASLGLSFLAGLLSLALPETRSEHERTHPRSSWSAVLRQRDLWAVWGLAAAFFFSMTSVFVYMKTWVLTTGIGSVGLYFAVYSGTAIVLRVLLGWVPDRVGPARVAAPTLLLYATGFVVLSLAGRVELLVLAAVLGGVGHGYGYPVLLTLVANRAGAGSRGSAVAVYGAIDDGAALIAAPVLGYAIETAGYAAMFAGAGGLVGATVVAHLMRENRRAPRR